jgi:hypothetical protein
MKLHHNVGDGTTNDSNTEEDIHTVVTATEFEVLIRGTWSVGGSVNTFINQVAAGNALTMPAAIISAAAELHGGVYVKNTTAVAPVVDFRDMSIAFEN